MKQSLCLLGLALAALLLAGGCLQTGKTRETACQTDADCDCGVHIQTKECFIGNKAFVSHENVCPDYCTGIAGNLEVKCVNNTCQ